MQASDVVTLNCKLKVRLHVGEDAKIRSLVEEYRIKTKVEPVVKWTWSLLVEGAYDDANQKRQVASVETARKVVARRNIFTVDAMIKAGILPALTHVLRTRTGMRIVRQAIWTVNDIASYYTNKGAELVQSGVVGPLIQWIRQGPPTMYRHAFNALGEIICESGALRDAVFREGYIAALLAVVTPAMNHVLLSKLSQNLFTAFSIDPSSVAKENVPGALQLYRVMLSGKLSILALRDTLKGILVVMREYRTDADERVCHDILLKMLELFDGSRPIVQMEAILCAQTMVNGIVGGIDVATVELVLSKCHHLVVHRNKNVRCGAMMLMSCMANSPDKVAAIIATDLMQPILEEFYTKNVLQIQCEAIWLMHFLTEYGHEDDVAYLYREGMLQCLIKAMRSKDNELVFIAMQVMMSLIEKCEEYSDLIPAHIPISMLVEKSRIMSEIYPNTEMSNTAKALLCLVTFTSAEIEP